MRKFLCVGALLGAFCGIVPSAEAGREPSRELDLGINAVVPGAGQPGESTSGSLPGSLDGCQEVNLFFTVDKANVRPLVPASYRLSGEANGTATLFIRGFDCRALVWNGETHAGNYPVAGTTVSVLVESPDGTGVVNSYVLFIATNSPNTTSSPGARPTPKWLSPT